MFPECPPSPRTPLPFLLDGSGSGPPVRSSAIGILVVCTGNTCRSPMAAALLARHLGTARVPARELSTAVSAGTLGWSGRSASPHSVSVMAERGIDLSGHVSRRLTRAMVRDADLVVAMTRDHAWAVAAHDPDAAARTFLLDELVRLGEAVGPWRGGTLGTWLATLDARRGGTRRGRPGDDVADPAGERIVCYREVADRLERSVCRLVPLVDAGRRAG